MWQIVDNFRPVRIVIALVLWALSFVWGISGELFFDLYDNCCG